MTMLVKFNNDRSSERYSNTFKPTRDGDAGYDLRIDSISKDGLIGTGVSVAIPVGYVGLALPRGGLGFKYGIELMNTVGVIDSNYRGEIMACIGAKGEHTVEPMKNDEGFMYMAIADRVFLEIVSELNIGDRFAQMVVVPYHDHAVVVDSLDDTNRGADGFGSSGVR